MEKNSIRKDEEVIRRSKTEIVIKLLKYLKPYKFDAVIVSILMILVMLAGIVNPFLLGIAIDDYVVNKNVNSIMSRLFLKTDKYSGELRLAKSKSISVVVFIVMFLFLICANAEFSFAIIVAGIIFGLIFAVPTYVIGYVIGIIFDKITH